MRTFRVGLSIAVLEISAFGQDVRYNFASEVDFSKYKSYRWVVIPGADQLDQIMDGQLKTAIDEELAKKGLTKSSNDSADLLLGYQVSIGQEKQMTTFDSGYGYGGGWGRGWYGYGGGGMSTTTTETIQIGQVDLDFYDAAAKKLVWRGTATKTLDVKASPEKRQKNMRKGAAKLLKKFPPPPKKG